MMDERCACGRINAGRVLLGGLLAGFVCTLSGMAVGLLVLHEEAQAFMEGMKGPPSAGSMFAQHVLMRMALGFLGVWLYAAIRPRFGPGPRTAVIAGFFMWLGVWVLAGLVLYELRVYSLRTTAIALLWSLFESVLMVLAGAWPYRDAALRPAGA